MSKNRRHFLKESGMLLGGLIVSAPFLARAQNTGPAGTPTAPSTNPGVGVPPGAAPVPTMPNNYPGTANPNQQPGVAPGYGYNTSGYYQNGFYQNGFYQNGFYQMNYYR